MSLKDDLTLHKILNENVEKISAMLGEEVNFIIIATKDSGAASIFRLADKFKIDLEKMEMQTFLESISTIQQKIDNLMKAKRITYFIIDNLDLVNRNLQKLANRFSKKITKLRREAKNAEE